jgi:hypothetical protein
MAVSKNNPLTHGASGMIGDTVVFRTWNGKTFMYNRPKKPTRQSEAQKENRLKFKMATAFAKRMMKDLSKKEEYVKIAREMKLPNAYTAAITEYMRKPEISRVDTSAYSGMEEQEIKVVARKEGFEVEVVEVIIINSKGEVVEQGKAVKKESEEWIFKSTRTIENPESFSILVRARERTGNYIDRKLRIDQSTQV